MLSQADNEYATRTNPGTPMGEFIRRFWMPALLTEELPEPNCPPIRLKLLGENLVAFRDSLGRPATDRYPCAERGGVIWMYMGPPELMAGVPELEWTLVAPEQRYLSKRLQQSNYLQAIEGGIDSSHISFLHSTFNMIDRPLSSTGGVIPQFVAEDKHPRFEVLSTRYGHLVAARRDAGTDAYYWRVSQYLVPLFR